MASGSENIRAWMRCEGATDSKECMAKDLDALAARVASLEAKFVGEEPCGTGNATRGTAEGLSKATEAQPRTRPAGSSPAPHDPAPPASLVELMVRAMWAAHNPNIPWELGSGSTKKGFSALVPAALRVAAEDHFKPVTGDERRGVLMDAWNVSRPGVSIYQEVEEVVNAILRARLAAALEACR